jgi:hypothetical protein
LLLCAEIAGSSVAHERTLFTHKQITKDTFNVGIILLRGCKANHPNTGTACASFSPSGGCEHRHQAIPEAPNTLTCAQTSEASE